MERPRLLFCDQSLDAIREKVKDPAVAVWWGHALNECDKLLEAPVNAPPAKASTPEDRSPGELMSARRGQGATLTLALGYLVTGRREYLERSWQEIECWLDRWTNWTDPAHGGVQFFDLMVGEIGMTMGVAYDWLKDDLSPPQRAKLREHLGRRILESYLRNTEGDPHVWWFDESHNWNSVCNGGAIVAALALGDEDPRSNAVIARATDNWKRYFKALGAEGGCDEGTGYWQYGMRYAVLALESLRERGHPDASLIDGAGLKRTGSFPISFCPGGEVVVSWGDASSPVKDPILYLLGGWYKNPDYLRYLDRKSGNAENHGWPVAAFATLFRPIGEAWLPAPGSAYAMGTAQVYKEIGWSVFTDSYADPKFIAGFKCGDLAANHTQLDNNTFMLWAKGEWLAVDLGGGVYNADYFSDKRWKMYVVELAGHNGVLIGGRGQQPQTQGKLTVDRLDADLAVMTGDATANYGPGVKKALRHFAVVRRSYVVVVDEIETEAPEQIEWRLHTARPAKVQGARAVMQGEHTSLHVVFPEGAVTLLTAEDSRELPPGRHDHLLAGVSVATASSFTLPVVLIPAPGEPPKVSIVTSKDAIEVAVGTDRLIWKRPGSAWTLGQSGE